MKNRFEEIINKGNFELRKENNKEYSIYCRTIGHNGIIKIVKAGLIIKKIDSWRFQSGAMHWNSCGLDKIIDMLDELNEE